MTTLPLFRELLVDCFAGGGGASLGIEQAMDRPVDIAINHDSIAIATHAENHPHTQHYIEDVFRVDPVEATGGMPVGLAWFSPDCSHHSKAKGGKPRSNKRRGLAWVVVRWAKRVRPRIIALENVEEFADWGPLDDDGRPCPDRRGQTFNHWSGQLRRLGYNVEHKMLRACDYGAPTTRRRLFLLARRDGHPIVWPAPTHGPGLLPYRTAAECIDWSIPAPSIFERKRPLADATCRRIARGIMQYVVNAEDPFIAPIGHGAALIQTGYGERPGQAPRTLDIDAPLGTVVAGGCKHALVVAFLSKYYGKSTGPELGQPCPTITASAGKLGVVTAWIAKNYTGVTGQDARKPLGTVTTVDHHSLVTAFLIKYYGNERGAHSLSDPLGTVTCTDRFGLVIVRGEPYRIVDIGLRMLQPHELAAAQGFPPEYNLSTVNGEPLTKRDATRLIGNSVSPYPARALVAANMAPMRRRVAA